MTGTSSGWRLAVAALLSAALGAACGGQDATLPADQSIPPTTSPLDALPDTVRSLIDKPALGDFDEMVKRRAIRVGVTFNRTHYFIDRGQEHGLTYESVKSFEKDLNERLKTGNLQVHVVIVPLARNQLHAALGARTIDMVAAMITVRPELEKVVAFSLPTRTNVNEIVVTGPGAPALTSLDDLAGREVFVRRSSTYYASITDLNAKLKARGKAAVTIREVPDVLEDDDILEMVNAGLMPITVVDDFLAQFWQQVFTDIKAHPDLAIRTGGVLAIAMRKDTPKLKAVVDEWVLEHGRGDALRNLLEQRYLKSVKYAKNATTEAERRKFREVVELFKKYGGQYDIDYLLMAAQGYQESTLDNNVKSPVGAVGVMQVMPSTGKQLAVGDIRRLEPNIHAGVKYMRFMMDEYFKGESLDPLNKGLMTFAAYNAGPGRLRQLRREAGQRGLNPNVWFGNVERVASERIGRETVTYVSNIYKYYVAYRLLSAHFEQQQGAKAQVKQSQP
jgi:membrane-bound lytic murein transglycosylase MltF